MIAVRLAGGNRCGRVGRRVSLMLLVMLLVLGGTLPACKPQRPVEREGGTLTVVVPAGAGELDPHVSLQAHPLLWAIYDTLLTQDAGGELQSGLAHTWTASSDGRQITLQLREGVTFHDGQPLDAQAVVHNFERILAADPAQAPIRQLIGPLRSAEANGLTLTLTYDQPFPPVWTALSDARLGILSPAVLAAIAGAGIPHWAGSGPYKLSDDQDDREEGLVLLERNRAYAWPPAVVSNPAAPYPDELRLVLWDPDGGNGSEALQQEALAQADAIWWPAGEPIPAQLAQLSDDWRSYPYGGSRLTYLAPVMEGAPFDDLRVRRALALAVERAHASATMPWSPTASVLAAWPGLVAGSGAALPLPDLAAAASLLTQAGWIPGDDGVRRRDGEELVVRLATYENDPGFAELGEQLLDQLSQLGIGGRLVPPRRDLTPGLVTGQPNLWLLYFDWPDPDVLYYLFHSTQVGRANRAALRNAEVDYLLQASRSAPTQTERAALLHQAEAILLRESAIVVLAQSQGELRLAGRVVGWRAHSLGVFLPHDIYLRDARTP